MSDLGTLPYVAFLSAREAFGGRDREAGRRPVPSLSPLGVGKGSDGGETGEQLDPALALPPSSRFSRAPRELVPLGLS